jgi:hypothetical protein
MLDLCAVGPTTTNVLTARLMKDEFVSASELARIGYCERQVVFDATCGRRTTPRQRQAADRGRKAHDAFLEESRRIAQASERKGRCFIATLALGDCQETTALRQYRDLFLRRSSCGRQFIAVYYRASPSLCRWLDRCPRALWLCRLLLRPLAAAAQLAVRRHLTSIGESDER